MMWIGRLGQLSAASAHGAINIAAASPTAKPKAVRPLILSSQYRRRVRSRRPLCGAVLARHQRADAARQAEDARPAFAFDLFGVEAKRGNAAIDRQAVAVLRTIERGGNAEQL